jgi:maltose alpha-D-glucosyltransferase / alpha-amylase
MRSFAYCRGTVEHEAEPETAATLRAWESSARAAFMDRYSDVARTAPVPIIPEAPDEIRRGLAALEIEKAVYECGYELNNRPDWLWLPLSRLVQST